MNVISINGLTIETNKRGMSMHGSVVVFEDGSTYNTRTKAFNNAGPGYVKVNGVTLENSEGSADAKAGSTTETRSRDFKAGVLSLRLQSSDVVVERHSKTGIRVEITGTADFIESITFEEVNGTLIVEEKASRAGSNSVYVSSGSIVMSGFGSNISIGGVNTFNFGGSSEAAIKVFAPVGTPIAVTSKSADTKINGIDGPLDINIAGSGSVKASGAAGFVRVSIAGSGSVKVGSGELQSLDASIAGSGKVKFDGTSQDARLTIAGSGDIRAARIINTPKKSVAGSGRIRVDRVG